MIRRRSTIGAAAVLVAAAVIVGVGFGFGWFAEADDGPTSAQGDVRPTPDAAAPAPVDDGDEPVVDVDPLDLPTPTPAPLGTEKQSAESADAAIRAVVDASSQIAQRGDGGTEGIEAITTGFVEGELHALAEEQEQQGYRQVGRPKITSVATHSLDLKASPPQVTLDVCIDASDVDVVDSNGESLADRLYSSAGGVLNVYTAVYVDRLWKIDGHEIPNAEPCT